MKRVLLAAMLLGVSAAHAATTVAVAAFDYSDTSGEVKDQQAAHAARLAGLQQALRDGLDKTGRFNAVSIKCGSPPCTADTMDAASLTDDAKQQGAKILVFGGVHKISTLIQWGRLTVVDVVSGKTLLNRSLTFRGDTDDAWQHAASYMSDMVVDAAGGTTAVK
jgi:hypothetical protein